MNISSKNISDTLYLMDEIGNKIPGCREVSFTRAASRKEALELRVAVRIGGEPTFFQLGLTISSILSGSTGAKIEDFFQHINQEIERDKLPRRMQWHTDRCYDEHGQRMVAEQNRENGVVTFVDHSRDLWGQVVGIPLKADDAELKLNVMRSYDHGRHFDCPYPEHLVWEGE